MKKAALLAIALSVVSSTALAREVVLVAHNLRSAANLLSTAAWKTCPGPTYLVPCINPANAWVQANGITGSTATWDWNPTTSVLTGTGTYEPATFLNSNPAGSSILADRVVDLVINTVTQTTTATSYECVEGTFVASVGSNACGDYSLGANFTNDSSIAFNVGGDAQCVQRTLGGDDSSIGLTRGLTTAAGGAGCDATAGAFPLWTIVRDDKTDGGTLILSNGLCQTCANVSYMTFKYTTAPANGANPDAASTIEGRPVDIKVMGNDGGFADPVTVTIVTPPANGSVVISGSPGPAVGILLTYTPAAGFQGIDTFEYSASDGVQADTAAVTVTVGTAEPSSVFAVDWPGYQANPAHTGYVPGTLNTNFFALRWQILAANGLALNPVAVGDGKVFVSAPSYFGNTGLYAYDAQSGALLWNVPYSDFFSVNPPAYGDGRVYIQTGNSGADTWLRAYDATTGSVAFKSHHDAQWENYLAPTILDDTVYINGGAYGGMYAFDAISGARRWFKSLAQVDRWTPAVDANNAYAYLNGTLTAVDRETGTTAYSITGPSASGPAVPVLGGSNDAIVIAGSQLIRLNLANHTVSWAQSGSFAGQPSLAKGVIYAIDGGMLSARAEADGALLWSWIAPGDTLAGPMIVTDSHVIVSGDNKTYAVNLATRTSDWNYPAAGSLALARHSLYIASTTTGNLTSIRLGPKGAYDDSVVAYLSTPVDIDVLQNDDGFVGPVTVGISTGPQHGTAVVSGSPGAPDTVRIIYTPAAGFQGMDTFEYTAGDGALSGSATVSVDVRVPQAIADAAETNLGEAVPINVLKNDTGFSNAVTVTITQNPHHGTAVVTGSPGNAAGVRVVYTPAAGFSGSDSLEYEVSNGINSATAGITVTVHPYVARNDYYPALLSSKTVYLPVALNDTGFQEPVTISIVNGPTRGSAYVYNSPGSLSNVQIGYFAAAGSYTDSLTYAITDGTRTDEATVTLNVLPFIAQDDQAITGMGTPVAINVAQNDLGFGYPTQVGLYQNPVNGSAALNGSVITYTPNPGFLGDDVFKYFIDDDTRVGIATVTVHVIIDADGDDIDDEVDNCLGRANADQRDTDGDGYGNVCDADLDNSGVVNFADLALFRQRFSTADPDADFDGNGAVNFADLATFRALFGKPPGPAGAMPTP